MRENIVVIGANDHIAPYIMAIREEGYRTHVFAWKTGDAGESAADVFYPVSILDRKLILDKCKEIDPVAVVTAGSDMSALTAAYISEKLGLPGNSYEVVKNTTNKLRMRRILEVHCIPQPKFVGIEENTTYRDSRGICFPVVVKPSDRSGGRAVKRVNTRHDVIMAISAAKESSFENRAIVEEYILGRHYSCECISIDGKHFVVACTYRKNLERYTYFKEHVHIQPAFFEPELSAKVEELIIRTLDALGYYSGASSVEFVIDRNDHIRIIEVSACMYGDYIASHLVPYTTGVDYMRIALQVALGERPEICRVEPEGRAETHFILQRSDISDYEERVAYDDYEILYLDMPEDTLMVPEDADGMIYGCYVIGARRSC